MKKPVKPLGLYIHIPFCKSKCIYCDFYSLPRAEDRMDRYVSALCRQLAEIAQRTTAHTVDSVYLGGGTPSYLGEKRLRRILKTVKKHYHLSRDAEITLEANPDSAGDWRALRSLRRAGMNRLSLGVQSADDGLLRTLGRPHTFAQAEEAAAAARRARIRNLSLDLIYGLPGQDLAGWKDTLERAAALEPEHLSCYGLKVEEGTPLWDMQEKMDLPDDDAQADMYLWTVERLGALGYEQYEISNFARPGRASRHNMKYWTLCEYAGFGPGAHSDLGDVRYAYLRSLDTYCAGVEAGVSVLESSEHIPSRERDIEYVMLGLRLTQGISRQEFENRYRLPFAPIQSVLERFRATGHAALAGERWRLTPEGFLVSNQLLADLLERQERSRLSELLPKAQARYSRHT